MFLRPKYWKNWPNWFLDNGILMRGNRFFKFIDKGIGVPLVFLSGLWLGLKKRMADRRPFHLQKGDAILIVKLSALGDTLLLLPALKALRQSVGPAGRIEMIATSVNEE